MMYEDILPYCERKGIQAERKFGYVFITTKYEQWYFEERTDEDAKVRLMHRNRNLTKPKSRKFCNEYHCQFIEQITPGDLIRYIERHEKYKYGKAVKAA